MMDVTVLIQEGSKQNVFTMMSINEWTLDIPQIGVAQPLRIIPLYQDVVSECLFYCFSFSGIKELGHWQMHSNILAQINFP